MATKPASSPDQTPQSRRQRRRRAVQYLIIIVGCVLIADALVGENGLAALLKARKDYRLLEASLARSRAENARLREEGRQLREDPAAVEEIARRELGFIKPGEKLFIVKDIGPADQNRLGPAGQNGSK